MHAIGIISLVIMVITTFFSSRGFTSISFFAKYSFEVEKIIIYKDYKRLITSGLLHVNWGHLLLNMLSFYFFSASLENYIGPINFLVIYLASLVGGNLLSLYIHRNHGAYSAVGASGAVCGVIFASVALFPGMGISLFGFLPLPGWLYCILFVLFSIYGIRSRKDNIGHDAHLGGALIGMITAIIMQPSAILTNYFEIGLILIPTLIFIFLIIRRPGLIYIDNYFFKHHQLLTVDDRYNIDKRQQQQEIDRILEKIHKRGMNSLTKKEKAMLKEFSKMK
jgi:membrane associated rhomboid family serine protease